jgi:flagellin
MALGVLNNLSAIYAENNLNNTNASLQKVLEQLSSGSQINSGADDAAGLSLVNGLEANRTALTQSATNATEGVGLLQVADGALSQVTSLLDRAITLATEASNGTLNSTQDDAANQEYQSILSEINNIGQTTTYNQEQVFNGSTVAIYTGDSSSAGSSLDDLNIRTLSETSVGDSGGKMAYSSGTNSVFINLSTTSKNAQATDTLNASGTTAIDVNYLVKGSNGAETTANTTITVGAGTSYANTADGMISAINASGLGLSASFATQAQAGVADGGTQTGIQITGGLLSAGVDPNSTSTSGILNLTGTAASSLLTQGQTVVIQSGSTTAVSIVISSTVSTLSQLASTINSLDSQVTASLITNSDGTLSMSLADKLSSGGALSVTTTPGTVVPQITTTDVGVLQNPVSISFSAPISDTGTAGTDATATLGITGINNNSSSPLSGNVILSNGGSSITISMNNHSASADATHIYLTTANSTLNGLAAAINGTSGIANSATPVAALDMTAVAGSTGLVLTSNVTGTNLSGTSALQATPALGLSAVDNGAASIPATTATTTLAMVNGGGAAAGVFAGTDTLATGSSIVITNGSTDSPATPITFVVGTNVGAAHTYYTGTNNNTLTDLLTTMDVGAGATAAGIATAQVNGNGQIVLTSSTPGTTLNATSSLVDVTPAVSASAPSASGTSTSTTSGTATLLTGTTVAGGDTLTGNVVVSNGLGNTQTFTMGAAQGDVGTTLTALKTAISSSGMDITAAIDTVNGGLDLTSATNGTHITIGPDTLAENYATEFTNPASGSNSLGTQYQGGILNLANLGNLSNVSNGTLSGTLVLTSNTAANGLVTDSFVMQSGGGDAQAGNVWNLSTADSNIAGLEAAINGTITGTANATFVGAGAGNFGTGADDLDVVASTDAASGGVFIQSADANDAGLVTTGSNLTDVASLAGTNGTAGHIAADANVVFSNASGVNNANDVVSGKIVLSNTGYNGGNAITFVMGAGTATNSGAGTSSGGGATFTLTNDTLGDLAAAVTASGLGLTATAGVGGLSVTSNVNTSTISTNGSALKDNYGASVNVDPGSEFIPATAASAILGITGNIGQTDQLSGSITLSNGGANYTFTMAASSINSAGDNIYTNGFTLADLATAITDSGIGLNATAVSGALQLQAASTDTSITVVGTNSLEDTVSESLTAGTPDPGILHKQSTATLDLGGQLATAQPGDVLTGSITLTGTNGTEVFTMGGNGGLGTIAVGTTTSSETLQNLAYAINNSGIGISASVAATGLSLTMDSYGNTPIIGSSSLYDTMGNAASSASLGSFSSESDTLSAGKISFTVGGSAETVTVTSGEKVSTLISDITADSALLGVSANWVPTGNSTFGDVVLTSNSYGTAGNITGASSNVTDTTSGVALTYTPASAYNIGISNSAYSNLVSTAIYDSSSGQTNPTGGDTTEFEANSGQSSGIATISYSDGAGQSLSGTDLINQTDAQSAVNELNQAISDVASLDGYIGAQINTLNSISQVMATQQENVVSAQNAIQATDYASATSNMSKYEILSQTGIAALAQANSVQQEVTKLLQ